MRIARNTLTLAVAAVVGASALAGCGQPTRQEVNELRDQQKLILVKLDELAKKLDQQRAAAPAKGGSGPDPDKAYQFAVGKSAVKGPLGAPVSIVEFSDYQCPFCARVEPLIAEALSAYPTQVNFVYKHFPLTSIHKEAMGAAQAAAAAQRQGKFWEMHDLLFANQRALDAAKLKEYAQQIGLDVQKFEADMSSEEVRAIVREDMQQAQTAQVRGTPTIFVNGKLLQNRTTDGLKQVIDEHLKQKSAG